ncbi:MAG TPA: NHL repeat-containing protein [Candidatus Binataceae bacterium]|jgi:sugar lactone lactonase YvrE|nr:NHL repeat-containing protein [Candidatus Binataceae bacterium]
MSPRYLSGWRPPKLIISIAALLLCARMLLADTVANRVLGQVDLLHNGVNIVTNVGVWTPSAVAVDRSVTPNRLYVADSGNHRVLGWRSIDALKNGASADLVIGQADFLSWSSQCNNAAVTGATLCFPSGVAVDGAGNLYVVDQGNNRVLEYDDPFATDTQPDTVFGQGGSFTSSACNKGGTISAATLCNPSGVAVDSAGNVYISDGSNSRVLEFDMPLVTDTRADRVFGQHGPFNSGTCNSGGVSAGSLCVAAAVALDKAGDLYVEDAGNFRALEYDTPLTNAEADLVFGQGDSFTAAANPCPSPPSPGALCSPAGITVDSGGNLYIADRSFSRIQEYNRPVMTGITAPAAVFGQPGFSTGQCNNGGVGPGSVCLPSGLASDSNNDLFLADFGNQRVLEYIKPLATTPPNTIAGLVLGQFTLAQNSINAAKGNSLYSPAAVALDFSVSPNRLYVADTNNSRVLGWSSVPSFANGAPADLVVGQPDFFSAGCNQNRVDGSGNSIAAADTLCSPAGVAVDAAGDLWIADSANFRVLQYNAPFASGIRAGQSASVVLGQHGSFTSRVNNNGGVSAASMSVPSGLAVNASGNLYVADPQNNRVLQFNRPSAAQTAADRVFGQGGDFAGSACNFDGGCALRGCPTIATADSLCGPSAVAVNAGGNVYIADTDNNRVLQFPSGASLNPIANVVVGQANFAAVNCTTLCQPPGVAVDRSGNLYAADALGDQIKEYNAPLTNNPPFNLVIGSKLCGQAQARADTLCGIMGLGFDSAGDLYAADSLDNRVLEYNRPAIPTPTPTARRTPIPTQTPRPTATPSPRPGFPFISALPPVIQSGTVFNISGSGFTSGSKVNFFVATATGAINTGPFSPVAFSPELKVAVPPNNPLGEGVVSVQVVNTDRHFNTSNAVLALLQGNPALGIPSITGVNSTAISSESTAPGVAIANVQTVVVQGSTVTLNGSGFDTVNGVAVDLFCGCPGGKVGPFFVNPSLKLTSTQVLFDLPSTGPDAPLTGPGSFVVSNRGADGTYTKKSNAVSVVIGELITVTAVSQSGRRLTVFGSGFSSLTIINLFNVQGGGTVNLGGIGPDGKPRIPLTLINQGQFEFTLPATAVPGPAYLQALNPPFLSFTSTANQPGGAITLH